jgi:hypothetical protein
MQRFQRDVVIGRTEVVGQLPVKRLSHVSHTAMETGKLLFGTGAVVGAVAFVGQCPVGLRDRPPSLRERLGSLVLGAITAGEIGRQPTG